jgi:hypothetical protein
MRNTLKNTSMLHFLLEYNGMILPLPRGTKRRRRQEEKIEHLCYFQLRGEGWWRVGVFATSWEMGL